MPTDKNMAGGGVEEGDVPALENYGDKQETKDGKRCDEASVRGAENLSPYVALGNGVRFAYDEQSSTNSLTIELRTQNAVLGSKRKKKKKKKKEKEKKKGSEEQKAKLDSDLMQTVS
ncbi:hypothetical protein Cadr_000015690 [Camelus dromedarius]|uniref:Uncharacterized protein n=1 Tax=Camelus dromedarius TaxID=9838 RepID=A0A5N4E8Y0_CAMDR|nr:hypothetical protein Cadr_000015690 [Camelus dromedarius]